MEDRTISIITLGNWLGTKKVWYMPNNDKHSLAYYSKEFTSSYKTSSKENVTVTVWFVHISVAAAAAAAAAAAVVVVKGDAEDFLWQALSLTRVLASKPSFKVEKMFFFVLVLLNNVWRVSTNIS